MATDTSKKSQTRRGDFIVRQIGKFWILKTHDRTKRLVFLDNAKDVQIEENILIADNQLFEIHEDENGDISFRKVENLSYVGIDTDGWHQREDYKCSREEAVTNVTIEGNASVKHDSENQNLNTINQTDPDYKNTIRADIHRESEDSACAVKQKQHIYSGFDKVICGVEEGSDIHRGSDDSMCGVKQDQHIYSGSDEVIYSVEEGSDIYRGSGDSVCGSDEVIYDEVHVSNIYRGSHDSVCGAAKGQEKTGPTAKNYEKIDRCIPKATKETSSNTNKSFNAQFEVDVESSDFAKMCGIEGKMTLRVSYNAITFEDPKTKEVKNVFLLPWIRRYSKSEQIFMFELGRKCPHGAGIVNCRTSKAETILQHIRLK